MPRQVETACSWPPALLVLTRAIAPVRTFFTNTSSVLLLSPATSALDLEVNATCEPSAEMAQLEPSDARPLALVEANANAASSGVTTGLGSTGGGFGRGLGLALDCSEALSLLASWTPMALPLAWTLSSAPPPPHAAMPSSTAEAIAVASILLGLIRRIVHLHEQAIAPSPIPPVMARKVLTASSNGSEGFVITV